MKIALVIDDAFARPDGVQEYVRAIAAYLGTKGHTVHVVCSGEAGEPPPGVARVHSLSRNVGVTFNGNSLRTPLPARRSRVRELMVRERFDVVHVMSPHSPVLAARVVREARRCAGSAVRVVGTFVILPDSGTSDLGIRILGRLLRRNLRLFDALCGLSGPAAELATAAYGIPAHAIPGPIDVAAMRTQAAASPWPNADGDHVIVTFLGRLVERKGVLELIAAVSAMTQEAQSQMRVRIGGKGPLADDARRAIERAGLESCIRLDGFIADADKAGYLAAADIAVFPATGGESFGVVLVEAMAAGAGCVVAGDNPGYRWTMGDPEAMVDPRDSVALASALEAWVRNPSQRALLHERQQRRVQDFDAAVVGAQLEALYGLR